MPFGDLRVRRPLPLRLGHVPQYRATTKRVERTRVGYLALGGFVATTLTLTDVLPRFGVAWPAIGNVLGILYLYFLSQTLFRYRLLDLNELVGKMAVLGTLVVLLPRSTASCSTGSAAASRACTPQRAGRRVRDPHPVRAGAQLARERHQPLAAPPAHRAARPPRGGAPRAARRRRRRGHGAADHDRARGIAPRHRRRASTCSIPTAPVSIAPASSASRRPSGSTPTPSARCSIACAAATSISIS